MIESTLPLIDAIVKADEALDPKAFVAVLTPEAHFRIGGSPALTGRDAIEGAVRAFFARITSLRHEIGEVWQIDTTLIYEAMVHYTMTDGRHLDLPYCNVLRLKDDLVADYRIYIDLSAL